MHAILPRTTPPRNLLPSAKALDPVAKLLGRDLDALRDGGKAIERGARIEREDLVALLVRAGVVVVDDVALLRLGLCRPTGLVEDRARDDPVVPVKRRVALVPPGQQLAAQNVEARARGQVAWPALEAGEGGVFAPGVLV
jgi:hypothetical protein